MPSSRERRSKLDRGHAQELVECLFEEDLHAKRVASLSNGVSGVLGSAMLSVHAIGQAYAEVADIRPRCGVKQVDRFLSNPAIDVARLNMRVSMMQTATVKLPTTQRHLP